MAKWKELPVTDDLKRYEPSATVTARGWQYAMFQTPNGNYVRLADVALLRLEVASLRQERDDLDRACKEWAETSQVNYQRAKFAEAELQEARMQSLSDHGQAADNFSARLKAEAERDALKAKLADAEDALDEAWYMLTVPAVDYEPEPEETGLRLVKYTLARLRDEGEG